MYISKIKKYNFYLSSTFNKASCLTCGSAYELYPFNVIILKAFFRIAVNLFPLYPHVIIIIYMWYYEGVFLIQYSVFNLYW